MLAELDAKAVAAVMPMLQAHNLPPNIEIVTEGSPADAIYFVASGRLARRNSQTATTKQEYGTGEVFGIRTMLHHRAHNASIHTTTKCRLLKLHREDFHRLESVNPQLAARLRQVAEDDAEPSAI